MTTGAVRLVSTELPGDHLVVCGMTTVTRYASAVSVREGRRDMGVVEDGEPPVGAVTGVTRT
jgi:hypothetical protein